MLLGEKLIAFRDIVGPGRRAWITAARIAAPRCSLAATRRAASAASITAGNSTSTAIASTCRTCRRTRISRTRSMPRPITRAERNGIVWVYMGDARRARRRCRRSRLAAAPQRRDRSPLRAAANATGCRRSRAISTPRISASCISASAKPSAKLDASHQVHRRQPRAGISRDRDAVRPDLWRLSARRRRSRAAPIGASRISCFRSGSCRRSRASRQRHGARLDPDG